jgi:hypothetical protein
MIDEPQIADFSRVIQLAVAPVLTAVGTLLAVLTNRLARSVDRLADPRRSLRLDPFQPGGGSARGARAPRAADPARLPGDFAGRAVRDLRLSSHRRRVLRRLCGYRPLAAGRIMFVLAMIALIGSLLVFLREIVLAVRTRRRVAAPADARSGDGEIARR